jgi:hypothetical protein
MSKSSDADASKSANKKNSKVKNGADVDIAVEPVVELTETQKVQLQCDNATLEVHKATKLGTVINNRIERLSKN